MGRWISMAKIKMTIVGLYNYNNELFDNMQLPDGYDKDRLILTILERCGDFALLYPNYDFMKMMIGVWSQNCRYMFQTLLDTVTAEYNPVENYDRYSEITRVGKNVASGSTTDSQTSFNSDSFKDTGKQISSGSDDVNETVSDHTHGNIGIRSAQELLVQSRELAMFNLYETIAGDFGRKVCIELY